MTASSGVLVDIDRPLLASSMWRAPFLLRHDLVGHPLVTRDAVVRLAGERPDYSISYGCSEQPVLSTGPGIERQGSAVDAAANIENNRSWIVLSYVDHATGYGELLDAVSTGFRSVLAARDGPIRARSGSIFMTSPRGVAPAHVDRHHNILLQVEGFKQLSVGEFDNEAVEEAELQNHFEGHNHLLRLPARFQTFTIGPGEGIYIPPYRPHWIVGHDNVTVGLSCSVRTRTSHRVELAHTFNSKVRRLGLRPRMPGVESRLDAAKAVALTAGREMQDARRTAARQLRGRFSSGK